MSPDKYPSILSHQMEAIVYLENNPKQIRMLAGFKTVFL